MRTVTLHSFLSSMDMDQRQAFAAGTGYSLRSLENVGYKTAAAGPKMAIAIERESGGLVPVELICPDADWSYIRGTAKRRAAAKRRRLGK